MKSLRDKTHASMRDTNRSLEPDKRDAIYNRSLIEASLDLLVTIGPDGKITDVNRATEAATGRSRQELVGTDFMEYFTDPNAAREGYQMVFRNGIMRDYPLEIRHSDGHTIPVLYNATVYKDDETGKVLGIFAAARDITGKKRAEEKIQILEETRVAELKRANKDLKKSQEELEIIIDSIRGLVFYKDIENNFLMVNKYIADAYHMTKAELKNKSLFDLHPKDQAQAYFNDDLAVIKSKIPRLGIEEKWETESGIRWVITDKIPHIDEKGDVRGIIGVSIDITDRKKNEIEINKQRSLLRQVIDTVPAFICVKTEAGLYELANISLARAFGTDVAGVEGKTDLDFSPTPEEAAAFRKDDLEVVREKKTKIITEEKITYANGTVHWYSTTKIPLLESDGACSKLLVVAMDVTELRDHREHLKELVEQRTADLKESQERHLEAQTVAHLGNWEWDAIKDKITGSAEFYRLFDAAPEKISNLSQFIDCLHPDDRARVQQSVADALKNDMIYDIDYRLNLNNGEWRDINAKGKVFKDDLGNPLRMIGTCLDITARKNAEKKLKQSEEKFKNLFENAQVGMYRAKIDGSAMLTANPMLAEITGYSLEELLSGPSAIHWAEPERRNEYQKLLIRDSQIKNFETKVINKGKEIRTFLLSAKLYSEFGYIEGTAADITERKRLEEDLRLKDFVFKSSLTADSIGNNEGFLTHVNPSFVKTWGYDNAKEIIGKSISDFLADQRKTAEIITALKEHGAWEGEYPARKKDGSTFIAQSKANIVLGADGKQIALYSSVIDITEKKRAEAGLKKALLDLSRSNQDLEQFAYIASHDLQEPLRMVSSYVKLLERRYKGKLDTDADDFINFAVDGAVRMQNLINDLLLFSRVNTRGKDFELIDLEAVFATVIGNLQVQIESTSASITHDPLPMVWADSVQQIQVLQNLIHNGIKFHRDESPRIHVSAKEGDDEWVFSVEDNGIGIEPQYFNRIFLIFHRLNEKDKYPGTGIGLSICKRITERHGGRIWVESEPGKGSVFFFTIPKHKNQKDEKTKELPYEFK